MDYSYYFRTELSLDRDWSEYDLFLSVFNSSDRVNEVYNRIKSESKYWLIIPEYEYVEKDYPKEPFIKLSGGNESEQLQSLLNTLYLLFVFLRVVGVSSLSDNQLIKLNCQYC